CNLSEEQRKKYEAEGRKPVVRFKVPEGEQVVVNDLVRGKVTFESDGIGDYVIVKSDGIPTYNFAVVIDDVLMEITHVIRGEEHLSNTPRQILIYDSLGFTPPQFAHISLILNIEGKKMSKRDGDTAVIDYYNKGYLPEAVVNFIALMGWSPSGEKEFFSMEELKEEFSLDRVSKSPAVFDINKLNYINAHYIKSYDEEKLADLVMPFIKNTGVFSGEKLTELEKSWLKTFIGAVKEKVNNLSEMKEYVRYFYGAEVDLLSEEARDILRGETVPMVLSLFKEKVQNSDVLDVPQAKIIIKQIMKELKIKGKDVFMPLRIALTGQMHGPELDCIIALLGKDDIEARLNKTSSFVG
ncbi:MAG: glutamate--tRNA ligase, partial [Eubacteriales bacterium]